MHCISLSLLCLEQTHPLNPRPGAARGCRVVPRVWKTQMYENNGHPQTSPLPPLTRTQGRCHGEEKPNAQHAHKGTCKSNAIHVALQERSMRTAHTQPQGKRDGAHPSPEHSPSLLPSPTDWRPTPTVRDGAHHPFPPCALSRPPPSHPPAIAKGSTKNRRRGPSVPLAGKKKEEVGACQQHSQQRDTQRDTETQSDSRYGN
ncbi:hypothetical protein TcCL_NonESM08987 [Trypanosoma cruzi]|nr:hypothetical protein TcCL_NonESM08987 [Trypanosoma cruzi]